MKSYGQYCSIARGLDVIGDRWTLLIVRELMLRGPSRFTEVKNGLPGVATNLLAARLRDLEQAGLVRHEYAPPPVATRLYELTQEGLALEPVLRAIGVWGMRYMADGRHDDAFHAEWLAYAPAWFTTDTDPTGPTVIIQLNSEGEQAILEIGGGQVIGRVGKADRADLTLTGPARSVLGVLLGTIDLKTATTMGLQTHGDTHALERLQSITAGEAAVPG